jgi:signal transduction histidine kinase/FixJ family two-component response regulator
MENNVIWLSVGAGLTLIVLTALARAARRRAASSLASAAPDPANNELRRFTEQLQQKNEEVERQRTELAAQAVALQAARDEAERANHAKSQFLANVSHEIRTPMSAILGYVELVLEEMELRGTETDRWRQSLATVRSNGHHLMEIINDILDISKIEAGKLAVEMVDCPVGQLATDVATLLRHRAESKGLALEVRYRKPIPAVIQSDPTRVRQILLNLVGNAIKFTECGQVSVELELLAEEGTAPQLLVDVVDTGIGMSPQHLEVIFEPFVQGDSSATRKYEGTGLGLSISQRLAELLGGTIAAESVLGQGSRFRLTLPAGLLEGVPLVDQPARVEPLPPPPSPRVDLRLNCHVLLAEDGPDNQRLIAMLLRKAGASVTIVDNGKLAVDLALRAKSGKLRRRDDPGGGFDVILMDMQMPVLDGCQATRQLRDAGYEAPIIALTANAMAHDREQCFEAGCDDFATKPIDRVTLLSTVARWAEFNAARTTDTVLVAPLSTR